MQKATKKKPTFPETLFVVRRDEHSEPYYCVYEHLSDAVGSPLFGDTQRVAVYGYDGEQTYRKVVEAVD